MPTYQLVSRYSMWYFVTVVAESKEDAEELFETVNPRTDGELFESSYEDSYIEEI